MKSVFGVAAIVLLYLVAQKGDSWGSSGIISLDEEFRRIGIGRKMEIIEDPGNTLKIGDVLDRKLRERWKKSEVERPSFGFTSSAFWVRFTIANSTDHDIEFYLENAYPLIDTIKFYIPENGSFREIVTGDYGPFSDRPLNSRTFVFPVKLKANTTATYYMYNHMLGTLYINLILWAPEAFRKAYISETGFLMAFYGIMLVMICYNLIMFFIIRRREYLYYTFFVLVFLMFQMTIEGTTFQYFWPDNPWWINFSMPVVINLTMLSIGLFAFELAGIKDSAKPYLKKIYTWSMRYLVVYAVFSLISLGTPYFMTLKISALLAGIMLAYILIMILILIIKEKNRQVTIAMIAASAILLGGMAYVLKTFAVLPTNSVTQWSVHIGAVVMVVLFSITLSDRINMMRKELKVLNEHLEDKVQERTGELEAAMEEMGVMNDTLIKTNRDLEKAQWIAKRDMDMAVNVQASLYPKEYPGAKGWDAAFHFEPMMGVSGDLFDFYIENGRLLGLALFDVSGHGIASGLITMIARSVFLRNFTTGSGARLNRVLEQANNEMIREIGTIDNYLTGILLRITDHAVEYVNAAHPDVLYRNPDSFRVAPIVLRDIDFKSTFLGIADIENQYKELRFTISKGGALLLYTDCLVEGSNSSGEMFGIERVQDAFAKAPDGTAKDMLAFIMSDYNRHIGNHPPNDDLTVIVLKKT